MTSKKRRGLGQGINALFPDESLLKVEKLDGEETVEQIDVKAIRSNPYQPRKHFDEKSLKELADSIRENGVMQPIILRQSSVKGYELVAGERRHKASQLAGLNTIPAIVRDLNEEFMIKYAILENLQREDLTPLEEAKAYEMMMDNLDLTQVQVADALGKSRSHIANHLRLTSLPKEVKELISEKKISMGQARTLRSLEKDEEIIKLANRTIKEELTVRQLEKIVSKMKEKKTTKEDEKTKKINKQESLFIKTYENKLRDKFGTDVFIKKRGNKGQIQIDYSSDNDLARILGEVLEIDLNE